MASLLKTWRRTRNSNGVSVRVLAVTVPIAAFVLILFLTWARLRRSDVPSRPLPMWKSGSFACQATLDWLDHTYDKRRDARILSTKNKKHKVMNKKNTKEYFDLFEPEATCILEERLGSRRRYEAFNDGPKFVCGADILKQLPTEDILVYNIGSDNNIEFEIGVHNVIGCDKNKTFTFDPTLTAPYAGHKYSRFYPWGLGTDGVTGHNSPWVKQDLFFDEMSFETIFTKLGHMGENINILKVDCEGCEWAAIPPLFKLIEEGKITVGQIQVELHMLPNGPEDLTTFFLAADKAKMRIFHKERNGWGCGGYKCVEYSFISEDFLRQVNRQVVCQGEVLREAIQGDGFETRGPD